jgi:hypothetical protein
VSTGLTSPLLNAPHGERSRALLEALERVRVGAVRHAADQGDHGERGALVAIVQAPQIREVKASELGAVPPRAEQPARAIRAAGVAFGQVEHGL